MTQSSTQPNPQSDQNKTKPAETGPQQTEAEKKAQADKAAAAGNTNVKS